MAILMAGCLVANFLMVYKNAEAGNPGIATFNAFAACCSLVALLGNLLGN